MATTGKFAGFDRPPLRAYCRIELLIFSDSHFTKCKLEISKVHDTFGGLRTKFLDKRTEEESIMNVSATLNLSADDQTELAAILGCQASQLGTKLNEIAGAATKEYLTMIRGQKVFKRGTDMLEYRLFLLIETTFGGTIPDESSVSSLFQTTITESRSLIRAVISKYQYQLRACIDATIKAALVAANRPTAADPYSVIINSQNVIDELNKMLAEIDGSLASVAKRRGSVSTYDITPSSYNNLCARLGVTPNP